MGFSHNNMLACSVFHNWLKSQQGNGQLKKNNVDLRFFFWVVNVIE